MASSIEVVARLYYSRGYVAFELFGLPEVILRAIHSFLPTNNAREFVDIHTRPVAAPSLVSPVVVRTSLIKLYLMVLRFDCRPPLCYQDRVYRLGQRVL